MSNHLFVPLKHRPDDFHGTCQKCGMPTLHHEWKCSCGIVNIGTAFCHCELRDERKKGYARGMTFLKRRTWLKRRTPLRRKPFVRKFPESPKIPANPEDLKHMSIKELEAILWTYFSIYIRKRDRIDGDYAKCITCPNILPWKQMHAGHCVTRQCTPLKFHELNNHAQCEDCNIENRGMYEVYIVRVRLLYGDDVADLFVRYKRVCPIKIYRPSELIELIYKYKALSEEP